MSLKAEISYLNRQVARQPSNQIAKKMHRKMINASEHEEVSMRRRRRRRKNDKKEKSKSKRRRGGW